MNSRKSLVGFVCLLICAQAWSQHVENVASSQGSDDTSTNKKTFITYDLIAPYANIPSQVKVKLTIGDKISYLKSVEGDVGELVYPGTKKTIIWDHTEELVHYSGEVNLSIEVIPSVKVPKKVKRGRRLTVQLASIYTKNKTYAVKLFQNEKELSRLNDILLIENTFPVEIPKKSKVKRRYQLAITDGEKTFFSNTFKVKPKVSRKWIIVPLLAIPAYFIVQPIIDDNKPLPEPPLIN